MDQFTPVVEIALGTLPLLLALTIHGVGMFGVQHAFETRGARIYRSGSMGRGFFAAMIVLMLTTHLAEMLVWAASLVAVGAIEGLRDAFYFAAGTYTTLGYAEGMIPRAWRLLGPMIAISGIFAFGWTTGILVNLVSQGYRERLEGVAERRRDAEGR